MNILFIVAITFIVFCVTVIVCVVLEVHQTTKALEEENKQFRAEIVSRVIRKALKEDK